LREFSEEVRSKRKALGLTLREASELVGIPRSTLHDLELGERDTSLYRAVLVAKVLKISLDRLKEEVSGKR